MLMLNVPATVGLMALARPIVPLIFERGSFDRRRHAGDRGGAHLLRARARRLLGVKIASPTFYALRDSRTPVIVSVVIGRRQPRAQPVRWCACSASAAWRSARRSRPCVNAGRCSGCSAADRRPRRAPRHRRRSSRSLCASLVMAACCGRCSHTWLGVPGRCRLPRPGGPPGVGDRRRAGRARRLGHLLRIEEFAEAMRAVTTRPSRRRADRARRIAERRFGRPPGSGRWPSRGRWRRAATRYRPVDVVHRSDPAR